MTSRREGGRHRKLLLHSGRTTSGSFSFLQLHFALDGIRSKTDGNGSGATIPNFQSVSPQPVPTTNQDLNGKGSTIQNRKLQRGTKGYQEVKGGTKGYKEAPGDTKSYKGLLSTVQ